MAPRNDRLVARRDRRFWYWAAAAVVALLIIGWTLGWFGGDAPPAVAPTTG